MSLAILRLFLHVDIEEEKRAMSTATNVPMAASAVQNISGVKDLDKNSLMIFYA